MDNSDVMAAAVRLGRMLSESAEYEAFVSSRKVAEGDTKAYSLLSQYRLEEKRLFELMMSASPGMAELSRCIKALDEVKESIMENEAARIYLQRSAEMLSMVAKVNETLGKYIDISPLLLDGNPTKPDNGLN